MSFVDKSQFTALGKRATVFTQFDLIEVRPELTHVSMHSSELSSFCPVTEQPDFYDVLIEIEPDKYTIETKTMKLYLQKFRNEPMFAEAMACIIANDIFDAAKPRAIKVSLTQQVRGGIQLKAVAERKQDE